MTTPLKQVLFTQQYSDHTTDIYHPSFEELCESFPVGQNSHSGLWGYERVHDCLNLNRCIYKSKLAAVRARNADFRQNRR